MFGFKKKNKGKNKNVPEQSKQVAENKEELKPEKDSPETQEETENEVDESKLTEKEKAQREKLKNVQSKISRILQSNNIEIVDENIGDEYEAEESTDSDKQKQQDYDSLKALFGKDDKNKAKEVTLTLDDFDYTYTGKYVDELDLIHMKNIKRIRLQNKHKKLIKRLIMSAAIIAVLAIGIVVAINMTKETPVYLKSVSLSQTSQSYFMEETFDYTGIYIIATYSDGRVQRVKLSSRYLQRDNIIGYVNQKGDSLEFTGGTSATLPFSYGGFNVEFTVNIMVKIESGLTCKYTSGIFDLKSGDYITKDYLITMVDYSNYNSTRLDFADGEFDIYVMEDGREVKLAYEKANGYKVNSDLSKDSQIIVRYENMSVDLVYGEYSVSYGTSIVKD